MKALNHFLEQLGHKLDIEKVSAGSPFTVQFQVTASSQRIRKTRQYKPSKFCFRGYPDFVVIKKRVYPSVYLAKGERCG